MYLHLHLCSARVAKKNPVASAEN